MNFTRIILLLIGFIVFAGISSCIFVVEQDEDGAEQRDSLQVTDSLPAFDSDSVGPELTDTATNTLQLPEGHIDTRGVQPNQIVEFAKTLIGTPYLYGSTNPQQGFDCSGFITYVFNRFSIIVPRSSIDFTNVGREIAVTEAKPGDVILFTGTNPDERFVGHMGIVVQADAEGLQFIHSTSGKAYGVTITPLNEGYKRRYVKTIRIFPQNDS